MQLQVTDDDSGVGSVTRSFHVAGDALEVSIEPASTPSAEGLSAELNSVMPAGGTYEYAWTLSDGFRDVESSIAQTSC